MAEEIQHDRDSHLIYKGEFTSGGEPIGLLLIKRKPFDKMRFTYEVLLHDQLSNRSYKVERILPVSLMGLDLIVEIINEFSLMHKENVS